MAKMESKGGGGNSHQRSMARARLRPTGKYADFYKPEHPVLQNTSTTRKLLEFFEHGWTLAVVGLVAALLGVFVFTPVLVICGVVVLLTFRRVGVVSGKRWPVQLMAYACVTILSGAALYGANVLIVRQARAAFDKMVSSIVTAVRAGEHKDITPVAIAQSTPTPKVVQAPTPIISAGAMPVEFDKTKFEVKINVVLQNNTDARATVVIHRKVMLDGVEMQPPLDARTVTFPARGSFMATTTTNLNNQTQWDKYMAKELVVSTELDADYKEGKTDMTYILVGTAIPELGQLDITKYKWIKR